MSFAYVLGALLALALLGGIGGLFWWVRRSTHHGRQAPGRPLPLFSHDRGALFRRDEEDAVDRTAEMMRARTDWQRQ